MSTPISMVHLLLVLSGVGRMARLWGILPVQQSLPADLLHRIHAQQELVKDSHAECSVYSVKVFFLTRSVREHSPLFRWLLPV